MELGGFSTAQFAARSALAIAGNSGAVAIPQTGQGDGSQGAGAQSGGGQDKGGDKPAQPGATTATGEPLSREQQNQVRELKKRDVEVRAHEQAHAAVGGSYASAPSYTYTQGPDGKKYAVGGEVQIDTSAERTPEATIRKMDTVIAAALAPAEPSSQDQAVARQAQQQRVQAQSELQDQEATERKEQSQSTEDGDEANGALPSDLLAQIIGQASDAESGLAPQSSSASQSASSAYSDAAALVAQVFGGA